DPQAFLQRPPGPPSEITGPHTTKFPGTPELCPTQAPPTGLPSPPPQPIGDSGSTPVFYTTKTCLQAWNSKISCCFEATGSDSQGVAIPKYVCGKRGEMYPVFHGAGAFCIKWSLCYRHPQSIIVHIHMPQAHCSDGLQFKGFSYGYSYFLCFKIKSPHSEFTVTVKSTLPSSFSPTSPGKGLHYTALDDIGIGYPLFIRYQELRVSLSLQGIRLKLFLRELKTPDMKIVFRRISYKRPVSIEGISDFDLCLSILLKPFLSSNSIKRQIEGN
ncbi:hypothetical protein XELAEV_18025937mg, partial [Xenopus laevis]